MSGVVPGSGWNAYFHDSEGNVVGLWQNVQLAGPPFALYRGMPTETVDVEAGFPIAGRLAGTGTVVTGALPETDAWQTKVVWPVD